MIFRRYLDPDKMPDYSLHCLRRLSDDDLIQVTCGWAEGTPQKRLAEFEIKRREGRTARLAVAIAFLSLVVSSATALFQTIQ